MDEKLTKIWKDEDVRWKIIFILISAGLSAVFAHITQDIKLTIYFIIITACVDVLVEVHKYIEFTFAVNCIFNMKKEKRVTIFVLLAIAPAFIGVIELFLTKQIVNQNLILNLFNNFVSNCLGALIVCSIIDHIKICNYEDIIKDLIKYRKDVYNTFLKIVVFVCFINAVNFNLNIELPIMDKANDFYLSFIFFYGLLVFYAFALRIINKETFSSSIKNIYPKGVLVWSAAFLISCNISAFFDKKSSRPILLLFNTLTAFVIAISILYLLSKRKDKNSDPYPWIRFAFFGLIILINSWLGFKFCEDEGNITQQIISGGCIFVVTLVLMLYLAKKQTANDKIGRQKHCIILIDDEVFLKEKNVLEEMLIRNNIGINRFNSLGELKKWVCDNDIDLN